MRVLPLLALGLAATFSQSYAAGDCQSHTWMEVSAEDASIMAAVRPQPASVNSTQVARADGKTILYSVPDYYGRMSDEDLSQIRSVQPQGEKIVLCPRQDIRRN
jgi:hypothetical protein